MQKFKNNPGLYPVGNNSKVKLSGIDKEGNSRQEVTPKGMPLEEALRPQTAEDLLFRAVQSLF